MNNEPMDGINTVHNVDKNETMGVDSVDKNDPKYVGIVSRASAHENNLTSDHAHHDTAHNHGLSPAHTQPRDNQNSDAHDAALASAGIIDRSEARVDNSLMTGVFTRHGLDAATIIGMVLDGDAITDDMMTRANGETHARRLIAVTAQDYADWLCWHERRRILAAVIWSHRTVNRLTPAPRTNDQPRGKITWMPSSL